MSQVNIAPMVAQVHNINAHNFFSRVPDGVWNLFSSWTDLDDYESLHHVIHKNKQCEPHWLNNLRQYAYHAEPLFDVFTSVKSLRFVIFVRKIDVPRGWELHLFLKDYHGKKKTQIFKPRWKLCQSIAMEANARNMMNPRIRWVSLAISAFQREDTENFMKFKWSLVERISILATGVLIPPGGTYFWVRFWHSTLSKCSCVFGVTLFAVSEGHDTLSVVSLPNAGISQLLLSRDEILSKRDSGAVKHQFSLAYNLYAYVPWLRPGPLSHVSTQARQQPTSVELHRAPQINNRGHIVSRYPYARI